MKMKKWGYFWAIMTIIMGVTEIATSCKDIKDLHDAGKNEPKELTTKSEDEKERAN